MQQFGNRTGIAAPDLRRNVHPFRAAIAEGQAKDDRHHQPALVREVEDVIIAVLPDRAIEGGPLPWLQTVEEGAVILPVLGRDGELVVLVVEIADTGIFQHPDRQVLFLVQRNADALGLVRQLLAAAAQVDIGIFGIDAQLVDRIERDIDVVGGVEPAAPEPVEIRARGFLDRAEEIGGRGPFELPAARIFLEREIEPFAPDHRVAQDVIGGGRLGIGVGADIQHRIRMRHDRHLIVRDHVGDHVARDAPAPRQGRIEFIARDRIEEGVDPLVHPGPLPLVRIDRHREIDVPDLVDNDAEQEHLFRQRIGARPIVVEIGARPVEGDHGIFHPAHRPVDALRGGIGIVEAEARIDLHRVDDGCGRIFLPQLAAFLGVEGHRHHGLVLGTGLVMALRIPGEFAARRPGEIAHVLRGIAPGLHARCAAALVRFGFLRGDDEDRRISSARPLQTLDLLGGQDLRGVLQHAGRRHDVIVRHGDRNIVIAEFQRELAPAQELLVVPAFIVRIGDHSRKPLRHQEDVVAAGARIVGEVFVARSRIDRVFLDDVEIPFDREFDALPRRERHRQIDPHQRAYDRALQLAAADQSQRADVVAELIVLHRLLAAQFLQRQARGLAAAGIAHRRTAPPRPAEIVGQFGHGIVAEDVLVELHPQPG